MYRQTEKVVSNIEMVNGEYSAIDCYGKLANLASKENVRNQILEIQQDEIKHFQQFGQIYGGLTIRQPQPKIIKNILISI